jgi:hypothetical protein
MYQGQTLNTKGEPVSFVISMEGAQEAGILPNSPPRQPPGGSGRQNSRTLSIADT